MLPLLWGYPVTWYIKKSFLKKEWGCVEWGNKRPSWSRGLPWDSTSNLKSLCSVSVIISTQFDVVTVTCVDHRLQSQSEFCILVPQFKLGNLLQKLCVWQKWWWDRKSCKSLSQLKSGILLGCECLFFDPFSAVVINVGLQIHSAHIYSLLCPCFFVLVLLVWLFLFVCFCQGI